MIKSAIIWINIAVVIGVVLLNLITEQSGCFFQFGWNDDLNIAGFKINSIARYTILLVYITILNVVSTMTYAETNPLFEFTIYNPDKKRIEGISRFSLISVASIVYLLTNVKSVFTTLVVISQIDVALFNVLTNEIAQFYFTVKLVKDKQFDEDYVESYTTIV